ncbi:MATE family efflux transporter [Thermococcus chitonophagus]|uniref:MATE family efflux transporter n=1 Tax=Thermococcus chitonophagus TaxID=54262 RepID=A0A160VR61_9EURY|nr:MATE family efflux transporter [Thermococcus chitonophagus]ASJ16678.1 MATE family efflux transporter [Thermococcus chitonophagus]CUX77397.1 Multi antimicrobial extrusion protein (Na(+)/drug antiporter), MATE family of MDR efflux pumps [Thermococcus chitonophagus]
MTTLQQAREEILHGNIEKTLLKLAFPLIINNLVQVMYNLADTFWLAKLGKAELSAPGTVWPLLWFMTSLGAGFVTAGFAMVSQYVGAGEFKKASKVAGSLYALLLFLSSILAGFGIFIAPYALEFVRVTPEVYPFALKYMVIVFAGIPIALTLYAFNFILRAVGDTRTPVIVNVFTIILNIILDPIFIFPLGMGVLGAALATVVSEGVGSVIGGYLLFTGKVSIRITLEDMKPDLSLYWKTFRIGLPATIGDSTNSFGFVLLTRIIYGYGTVAFATYTITNRLTNFMFAFANGISQAMGTMVGQNVGAEKYERAKIIAEKAMLINFLILSLGTIIFIAFREQIFSFFIKDPGILRESEKVVKYFAASFPFFGIFAAVTNVFASAGHTKKNLVLGTIRLWGLRIPLSYYLGKMLHDSAGVWIGMGLSNVISALIGLAWFMTGSWMRRIIE